MDQKDEVQIVKHNLSRNGVQKSKKRPVLVKKEHPLWALRKREHIPDVRRGFKKDRKKIIECGTYVTLTPVNTLDPSTEFGVMAKADYIKEEKYFFSGDHFPKWDDPRSGKAQKGEVFAFCHNQVANGKDLAELFYVTGKKDHTHRPKHWMIPAHSGRDVIELSRYVGYARLTDLMFAAGLRKSLDEGLNCLRGTTRRKLKIDFEMFIE